VLDLAAPARRPMAAGILARAPEVPVGVGGRLIDRGRLVGAHRRDQVRGRRHRSQRGGDHGRELGHVQAVGVGPALHGGMTADVEDGRGVRVGVEAPDAGVILLVLLNVGHHRRGVRGQRHVGRQGSVPRTGPREPVIGPGVPMGVPAWPALAGQRGARADGQRDRGGRRNGYPPRACTHLARSFGREDWLERTPGGDAAARCRRPAASPRRLVPGDLARRARAAAGLDVTF
jgi:hypothetical protein